MRVHPYLHFSGQGEAAFKFYEKCLGAKIQAMIPHEGTPPAEYVPAEMAQPRPCMLGWLWMARC
jgi:PhnB protein